MAAGSPVLLSWVAVNNDPYERHRGSREYRLVDGQRIPGPTLTLLFDPDSELNGKIRDAVLLYRSGDGSKDQPERRIAEETKQAIEEWSNKRNHKIHVVLEPWPGDDPTDHKSIFEFLRRKVPEIRKRYAGRELIIHVSPGTGAMHTVWVLMAETGFIGRPFRVVQSLRKEDRHGHRALIPIELGIETFYKVYMASRPAQVGSDEQDIVWDPERFRTPRMQELFTQARRFAHLNVPILLLGERGTGKTTLASWIRLHSPFRRKEQDAKWPSVACGQYSAETMRAELFGYKKGAFTGATEDREGLLAAAHGDTLFLDEIGDVSQELQRLLIRALEERRYFPLGDQQPRKSNFRLLTATNLGPDELQRRLHPDFLDRISLLTLRLPPLREIREELDWLWEEIYDRAAQRAGVRPQEAALGADHHREVISHLRGHPLPGNLRDLFRVAYRIIAAKTDPHEPLSPRRAVSYGLQALSEPDELLSPPLGANHRPQALAAGSDPPEDGWVSRAVARAFADAKPLDSVVAAARRISVRQVEGDLKAYLAGELERIARHRGVTPRQLCDVSDRSLRAWKAGRRSRKKSSN
ncbi:MAG: sigma 54-interacting transcriptional regulator [Myxococcales bacterium]|nr:sigma 54-interacting transcriptional regulator [Myxococcota bacterium]MDW8281541.1 sigma 54-interacting transcriptional regulator [Myxococcales bacterium]